jgi:uncharacterized metal-binding protein
MRRFGPAGFLVRFSYAFCHRSFLCLYYFHTLTSVIFFPSVVFVLPVLISLPLYVLLLLSCKTFEVDATEKML